MDPGSLRTGWALVGGTADSPRVVECGAIVLNPNVAFAVRLHRLQQSLTALVARLRPASAAVESPFHGASARSALQLAHARGVILAVLAGEGIPVTDYSPATVKKAVTGHGRADKAQVQFMVRRIVGSGVVVDGADVADAVAVALCDLAHAPCVRAADLGTESARRSDGPRTREAPARPGRRKAR